MKRRKVLFFIFFPLIIFSYCSKPTFDNPFDTDVSINAPSDFTYSIQEIDKIRLEWIDNYNNETGFKIDKKVNTDNWQEHYVILETDETSWIDTLAGINDTLQYRICAIFDENYSEYLVTEKINNIFPAPLDLNCTPIDIDQIELEWIDNSIGEDGFIIEQKENEGNFIEIGNTSQSNYIASNLSFDSDYIFRVKAFSGNNYSDYSNEFYINIKQAITPTNLNANAVGSIITLSWDDNCTFEEGYKIERKENGGSYYEIAEAVENDTTFIDDEGLTYGTTYFYRVHAYIESNYSNYSNEATATLEPPSITIISPNGDENWNLGSSHYITWTSTNAGNYVKIVLYKNGSYYCSINSSTYNDGSYYWNISNSYVESNYYKIKITDTGNSSTYDYSDDYFSLASFYGYVTIGSGTGSWDYPFYTYYHDARTQILYLSSEIGRSGSINKIAFYVTTIPGQTMYNFVVRMKHTSATYFSSSNFDNSNYTTCLNTTKSISNTGWVEIPLSTSFYYNGTNNLIIDVSFNNTSWTSSGSCRYSSTSNYRSIYYCSDSNAGNPLNWSSGSRATKIPNIRLYFE